MDFPRNPRDFDAFRTMSPEEIDIRIAVGLILIWLVFLLLFIQMARLIFPDPLHIFGSFEGVNL